MHNLNKKGLTLVELVVAMGLFGMLMVTLFPALLLVNRVDMTSKEISDSNYQAQSEIETIRNYANNSSDPLSWLTVDGIPGVLSKINTTYPTCVSTCSTTSGTRSKTTGNFKYVLSYLEMTSTHVTAGKLIKLNITVTKFTGDNLGQRAEIEYLLRLSE